MPKVFLCYRREDSAYPTHQIYRDLSDRFGPKSVVFDIDTIPLGTDFREYLNGEVSKCDVLLAVIGDRWLEILDQRLNEPKDFVRIEIQAALERQIPIVPVLVGKASLPNEKDLPQELMGLPYKQAAEVRAGPDLQNHLKRLIRGLEHLLSEQKTDEDRKLKEAQEARLKADEENKRKEAAKKAERARIAKVKRKAEEERLRKEAEVERKAKKESKRTEELKREEVPNTFTNSIGMKFVLIPSGSFTMGSRTFGEYVEPTHEVKISQSFYLQTTQVTQQQWEKVMRVNPSYIEGWENDCPVEEVYWHDAQKFIQKLNDKEGTEKNRLPTEAEWEYACRAGTKTGFYFGNDADKLGDYAWYGDNSGTGNNPVGQKEPNTWGLYDMHGNVWEWVEDDWHDNYKGAPTDGSAWIDETRGSLRVIRGGSWNSIAQDCRSANRNVKPPFYCSRDIGFRLARSVDLSS